VLSTLPSRLSEVTQAMLTELSVHDNGPGIEPAEQRAIFEQFQRGRAAEASGVPGVGLGLSFVRAIVRGHGGKLDFESRPGRTFFRIRLKRRRELAAVGSPAPDAVEPAGRLAS